MDEKYIISKEELLELLESYYKLACLEQDGVDNWGWYMEGRIPFIANALGISEEEVEKEEYDFGYLASTDLETYERIVQ